MVTGVFLGLATFLIMSKASEIAHSSASSISLFFAKNIIFFLPLGG